MKKTKKKNKPRLFVRKTDSGKDREIFGKKVVKEEKVNTQQLPRFSRRITDLLRWLALKVKGAEVHIINNSKILISLMISLVLAGLIFYIGIELVGNIERKKEKETQNIKIVSEIEYWQQVIRKYNNYRDAYFQLAILEYKMGDWEKSRNFLEKVMELDPNFEAGKKMQELL